MADEATVRKVVERFFEFTGADVARAEELYHADAVLEFPQSGERFEGRDTFTEWRSQYPVAADDMRYRLLRVTARDGNGQWKGRVQRLVLDGKKRDVVLSGDDFRFRFGLRSTWFRL